MKTHRKHCTISGVLSSPEYRWRILEAGLHFNSPYTQHSLVWGLRVLEIWWPTFHRKASHLTALSLHRAARPGHVFFYLYYFTAPISGYESHINWEGFPGLLHPNLVESWSKVTVPFSVRWMWPGWHYHSACAGKSQPPQIDHVLPLAPSVLSVHEFGQDMI